MRARTTRRTQTRRRARPTGAPIALRPRTDAAESAARAESETSTASGPSARTLPVASPRRRASYRLTGLTGFVNESPHMELAKKECILVEAARAFARWGFKKTSVDE